MSKFGKHRSVDSKWLTVPVKYMFNVIGKDKPRKDKYVKLTVAEAYQKHVELFKWAKMPESIQTFEQFKEHYNPEEVREYGGEKVYQEMCMKHVPGSPDKTFVIVALHKKSAVCAWKNEARKSVGMTFTCPVVKKGKYVGIIYKDKFYSISDDSGWVI